MSASASQHVRHRPTPQITANDLARYMVASETGKIGIIRRSREAATAVVVRYSDARQIARAHLADPTRNARLLSAAIQNFEQRSEDAALTPFAREDARLSIDVLNHLLGMQNLTAGYMFVEAPRDQQSLTLAGVAVAVNLDLLVTRARGTVDQIGGALFRFTKADDETDSAAAKRREMGMYAATLAYMQTQQLAGNRQAHHQLSLSIDVQCREIHIAPRTFAQRMTNLENACRFIAALWGTA
jgi:hypothetical protein